MKTVLVNRSIAEYGHPKETLFCFVETTDRGGLEAMWASNRKIWEEAEPKYEPQEIKNVTHWLETIPLSQLIEEVMPTEEDIMKEFGATDSSEGDRENKLIRYGIQWLKTQLTK